MTIDDKIKDEKLQYNVNRKTAKTSALSSGKIDKYKFLTGEEILPSDQSRIIEQAKFTYSPLGKAFENQTKTIEEQGRKQIEVIEEHGKQLVKSNSEKESLTHLKQKEIDEIANERIDEIQILSKQIDFDNLNYYFKGERGPKIFIGCKGPLNFYKTLKDGYTTVEKAEENKKKINQI